MSDDNAPYPVGPPRHTRSRGAVITAYADTGALERDCPPPKGCGAEAGAFCVFGDGSERHVPCVSRTREHREAGKP